MRTCPGSLPANEHDDLQVLHQIEQFIESRHAGIQFFRSDRTRSVPPRHHVPHCREASIQSGLPHEVKSCFGRRIVVIAGYETGAPSLPATLERRHWPRLLEEEECSGLVAPVQRIEVRYFSAPHGSEAPDKINKRPGTLLSQELTSLGEGGRISQ
jgi:hypothetical protein